MSNWHTRGGPRRGASGPLLFALGCVLRPSCTSGVPGVVCVPSGVPGAARPGRGAGLLGVPEPRRSGPFAVCCVRVPCGELPAQSDRAAWCARAEALRAPLAVSPAALRAPLAVSPAEVCVSGLPCGCALISHARQSPISHVIPLHIFHTLKSGRWNCNVSRRSRKMTELNYVRNLAGGGVAAHGHRSLAIRALRRPPHQCGLLCCVWCPVGASLRCPALADGPHEQQFRMQFPRDYFNLRNSCVEIATFSDIIELSSNGIACEIWGRRSRRCPQTSRLGSVSFPDCSQRTSG